jgi:hypothetical protein
MHTPEEREYLDQLLPRLEAEHQAEADQETRAIIWALIDSVETYLLAMDEKERQAWRSAD